MSLFEQFQKRLKEVEEKAASELGEGLPETEAPAADQPEASSKEPEAEPPEEPVETKAAAADAAAQVTPVTEQVPEPEPAREPEPAVEAEPEPQPETERKPEPEPAEASEPERPSFDPSEPIIFGSGKVEIDPAKVEDILFDLELMLLEADVALEVCEEVLEEVKKRLLVTRVGSREDIVKAIDHALKEALRTILDRGFDFDMWLLEMEKRPFTIMFVGVNGTGKTTTIGRIGHRLKGLGFHPVLAAGDTFRAGAIEQLERWGERLGFRTIKHSAGSDPAAVAYDAVEHAKSRKKDVVLLDTAGRMQTNSNLMDELRKVARVAKPDLTVFVGDSLAGNDAIMQAREFDKVTPIDCVVLTKVDTDAKGGAALSIARAVGKPIAFLGVGQELEDIVSFDPEWLIQRIFGEV